APLHHHARGLQRKPDEHKHEHSACARARIDSLAAADEPANEQRESDEQEHDDRLPEVISPVPGRYSSVTRDLAIDRGELLENSGSAQAQERDSERYQHSEECGYSKTENYAPR